MEGLESLAEGSVRPKNKNKTTRFISGTKETIDSDMILIADNSNMNRCRQLVIEVGKPGEEGHGSNRGTAE